jgi:sugar lactone lactonase YvrE
VTLLAGTAGVPGLTNDTGDAAQFQLPAALAVAPDGSMVVADAGNHAIRRVTGAGVVTLLAGGTQGATEGSGSNAQFNAPEGVAADPSGNVFIADTGNNKVRRISNGQTTTTTVATAANGVAMISPSALCADLQGNILVADRGNFRVLRIAAGGNTAVVMAGGTVGTSDGTGTAASFQSLVSIACDFSGNVYVGDGGSLRRITPAGVVTTPRLTLDGADTVFLSLYVTCDRNADGSVLFATDDQLHQVFRLVRDADGNYDATALAGSNLTPGSADGTGTAARFRAPRAPAVRNGASLIVPDYENHTLRLVL